MSETRTARRAIADIQSVCLCARLGGALADIIRGLPPIGRPAVSLKSGTFDQLASSPRRDPAITAGPVPLPIASPAQREYNQCATTREGQAGPPRRTVPPGWLRQ